MASGVALMLANHNQELAELFDLIVNSPHVVGPAVTPAECYPYVRLHHTASLYARFLSIMIIGLTLGFSFYHSSLRQA